MFIIYVKYQRLLTAKWWQNEEMLKLLGFALSGKMRWRCKVNKSLIFVIINNDQTFLQVLFNALTLSGSLEDVKNQEPSVFNFSLGPWRT